MTLPTEIESAPSAPTSAEIQMSHIEKAQKLKGYSSKLGSLTVGAVEDFLKSPEGENLKGRVQLIFTSPPFPLNRKKKYGNLQGEEFSKWLASLADSLIPLLTDDGSIVIEMGNSWVSGSPTMSTLALRSMLKFLDDGDLHLCQQFIYYNPAKLPSPAQWVNVERIRLKDSHTHLWWMSKSERPKANNRNVLKEYSGAMKDLIRNKKYNSGKRPSQHNISEGSFFTDNGGAIPSSVLSYANTSSREKYLDHCKEIGFSPHPARMPTELPEFFIKLLTDVNDIVFDPFGGSNTTGAAAEVLSRRWLAVEKNPEYAYASLGRFPEAIDVYEL